MNFRFLRLFDLPVPAPVVTALLLLPILFTSCGDPAPQPSSDGNNARMARELSYPGQVEFMRTPAEQAENAGENLITSVDVALALTEEERQLGLMNIHRLPSSKGMLFIFDEQAPLSFWMANTPLSLDIIFVNEEMRIVRIHTNTTPYSQQQYPSEVPARYVVEVTAGFTARHDIQEGQYISFDLGES